MRISSDCMSPTVATPAQPQSPDTQNVHDGENRGPYITHSVSPLQLLQLLDVRVRKGRPVSRIRCPAIGLYTCIAAEGNPLSSLHNV